MGALSGSHGDSKSIIVKTKAYLYDLTSHNHAIVSDVKGRAAFAFAKFGVYLAFSKVLFPFTHYIVTLSIKRCRVWLKQRL